MKARYCPCFAVYAFFVTTARSYANACEDRQRLLGQRETSFEPASAGSPHARGESGGRAAVPGRRTCAEPRTPTATEIGVGPSSFPDAGLLGRLGAARVKPPRALRWQYCRVRTPTANQHADCRSVSVDTRHDRGISGAVLLRVAGPRLDRLVLFGRSDGASAGTFRLPISRQLWLRRPAVSRVGARSAESQRVLEVSR